MLQLNNTILIVIDVQGKLAQLMYEKETMFTNLKRMIQGAQVLDLPILWTEQLPDKLGATTPEVADLLQPITEPIVKVSFSCLGCEPFVEQLAKLGRRQVLLTGMETHICVYQTARDLLAQGYEVQVVTDAVSSRLADNKALGLSRMQDAGATMTSVEMALFELLQRAEGEQFRTITRIVK